MTPIEFTRIMKVLATSYGKDFDEETIGIWYMQFEDVKYDTLKEAVNNKIRTNKYMPSIAELLEEIEKVKEKKIFSILENMKIKGYFKNPVEYDKATRFLETGIIPKWFKEDMKRYMNIQIEQKEKLYLK